MTDKLNISCPHCGSTLKIDIEAGVVVSHEPPVHHKDKVNFDDRLQQIGKDQERAADRMAEAMRRERDKSRLMDDRFHELFDDAKKQDDGKKPIKDIDLD
jgi:hypothetical protein